MILAPIHDMQMHHLANSTVRDSNKTKTEREAETRKEGEGERE